MDKKMKTFIKQSRIPESAAKVFAWHARSGALQRLTPPWERIKIIDQSGGIEPGAQNIFKIYQGPIPIVWHAEHREYKENRLFQDVQLKGPFSFWKHTHHFIPDGDHACLMEDHIEYQLPGDPIGPFLGDRFVRSKLNKMFDYRHRIVLQDMKTLAQKPKDMKIIISGASGVIGSALIPFLTTQGHSVVQLVRKHAKQSNQTAYWDPQKNEIDSHCVENSDAVIHLAGENIGEGRWTNKKKQSIVQSRTKGTQLIADTIAKCPSSKRPDILISASAIGYYGNRGDQIITESDTPGDMFISYVCKEWENAAKKILDSGVRVVFLRIGVVLTPSGGALAKLYLPFKSGMGCIMGSGNQYMSWIALDDVLGVISHALYNNKLKGPVNVTSPEPLPHGTFMKTLAQAMHRPVMLKIPSWVIKGMFGQMGQEVLLSGVRVYPEQLIQTNYSFQFPKLEQALHHML